METPHLDMALAYCPACAKRSRERTRTGHPGVDPKHELHPVYQTFLAQMAQCDVNWQRDGHCYSVSHVSDE